MSMVRSSIGQATRTFEVCIIVCFRTLLPLNGRRIKTSLAQLNNMSLGNTFPHVEIACRVSLLYPGLEGKLVSSTKTLERKSSIDTLSLIDNFFSETTTPYDPKDQENHRSLYIYFSNEAVQSYSIKLQKFWKAVSDKFGMDILVYVPQKIRHKKLEDDDTYVVWKNRIVTMKDIGFHVSHDAGESYFYLYYKLRSNHEGDLDVSEFMEFMKSYLEEEEEAASAAMTLGQY